MYFDNPRIFKEGFLTNITEKVLSGKTLLANEKLHSSELNRLATIYGHLSKEHNLYNLLFKEPAQLLEVDLDILHTRDLSMFTLLSHSKPRGWYWMPDKGGVTNDRTLSNAVPLAFLGARRVYDRHYSSWLHKIDMSDFNSVIECDIFLPYGLASLHIDPATGEVLKNKKQEQGLISLMQSNLEFDASTVHKIRAATTKWHSNRRPAMLRDFEQEDIQERWNASSTLIRCMLLQGWIFSQPGAATEMITNYMDWDSLAINVDRTSTSMEGLEPTNINIAPGFLAFMGATK